MCIILPVDHLSCTHTVAIWQHCIDAPRSRVHGLKPCSHIRQHPRPILTRKLCYNCGGPRFFARRGGIAARGQGSSETIEEEEEKDEKDNDSGYASDAIPEEDEDADSFSLSPRSPRVASMWSEKNAEKPRQSSTLRYRSPSRKTSWKPSLKRELGGDNSPFCRRESVDSSRSSVSKFEDDIGRAPRRAWPAMESSVPAMERQDSAAYSIQDVELPSASPRKNSTLLHPSSPPMEDDASTFPFPSPILRPVSPEMMTPPRTPSTLLHPSTPEPPMDMPIKHSFPFPGSRPADRPSTPPQRPTLRYRNNSTLLHPSPPTESRPTTPLQITLPVRSISVKAKENRIVVEISEREAKRRSSVIHSALSDVESEYSESDYGSEEEEESENERESSEEQAECADYVVARSGMMSRASRISFHGAQMRVLRSL